MTTQAQSQTKFSDKNFDICQNDNGKNFANSTTGSQDFFSYLEFEDLQNDQLPSPPKLDNTKVQSFETAPPQQQTSNSFSNIEDLMKYLQSNLQSGENKIQINGQTLNLNFNQIPQTQGHSNPLNQQVEQQQKQQQLESTITQKNTHNTNQNHDVDTITKFKIQESVVSTTTTTNSNQISDKKVEVQETSLQVTQLKANGISQLQNAMIDMKAIQANMKLDFMDNDDLLIISDLEDNEHNTIESTITQNNQCQQQNLLKTDQKENLIQGICQSQEIQNTTVSQQCLTLESKSLASQHKTSKNSDQTDVEGQLQLKRHNTERPLLSHFIVSQDYNRCMNFQSANQIQTQNQMINTLKSQLNDKSQEVLKLKDTISRIGQCLAKIYSSPQLLQKDIDDTDLIQILSQGFLSQAKLHLAFLFSSPLIMKYRDDVTGVLRSQTIQQIDHEKEFRGVIDSISNIGNHIRYRKIPATLDNLRVSLTENPIALHFSGHGIENNKENFGKDCLALKDEGNFLIFEDNEGCAQFMSEKKLHELLEARGTQLEFVFVASCYSQFAGEIFHNAGAKHVICVQRGYQISDEASIIFSKNFYHALFSQTVTVCQAFDLAKAALKAEKNKALAAEARKFVILKDIDDKQTPNHLNTCNSLVPLSFKAKKHKCTVFGPFMKGNIENVGQDPMFRLDQSKVEDFIGRRKEMQEIISDIFNNRFVTIKGIPGIGKTTIAKAIMHYLDERQTFKDGIILLSLRGVDQANMILTRLQLLIKKHLPTPDKEDKSLDSFSAMKERIMEFLKDKEILLCLDNAEDILRKEGKDFRENLQNFLVTCQRIKILTTSRYPIGQLADISEKIYCLKELPSHFAIELLIKKAMRPIDDQEIQDLLQSANPTRILHSNPVGIKKNIRRLDEHHICTLLGGHPHAISLAAPLLQDKSLKELYTLLNSPEIIEWLQIEGIEGTPLASLKVSLDTSIQHMTDQEPLAIKLFCLIGLFPGGCTEEDLDYLWKNGWIKLAEKLLRASLLVKKSGQNNEIRYTLFPFMNQYAVQLMDDESRLREHNNVCMYLAKICKDLLKLQSSDILSRLVSFETNIWACIYRIIDKNPLTASEYSVRGKSPASNLRESQHLKISQVDGGIVQSQEESSQGEHSCERQQLDPQNEDYYDTILYQKRQNDQRSKSERVNKRSLINENQTNHNSQDQEETKTQVSVESQQQNDKSPDNLNRAYDDIQQLQQHIHKLQNQSHRVRFNQPQTLMESQYDEDNLSGSQPQSNDKDSSGAIGNNDCEHIFPTKQIANQLSDDQISLFLSTHSNNNQIKKKLRILEFEEPLLKIKTEEELNDIDLKSASNHLNQNEIDSINRSSSNDFFNNQTANSPANQTMMNINSLTSNSNTNNSLGRSHNKTHTMHEISYLKLSQLPQSSVNLPQYFDEDENNQSVITYQNEQFETTSMDSLQSHLLNMNMTTHFGSDFYNQSSTFCYQRRKSALSKYNQQNLDNIDETFDEDNSCILIEGDQEELDGDNNNQYDEEEEAHNNSNILKTIKDQLLDVEYTDQDDKQPQLLKRLSSKKYQEDDVSTKPNNIDYLQIPISSGHKMKPEILTDNNENNFSGQEDNKPPQKTNKTRSKQKRVTIQENVQTEEKKSLAKLPQIQQINPKSAALQKPSVVILSPEGSLLVYYVTNLVVLKKYEEALKTIENFGLKYLVDKLCYANLLKIQGYILSETTHDYKEVQLKYDEAYKIFQYLKISHGQASCSSAMGTLLYHRFTMFITKKMNENKVFDRAMKKFEDAVVLYQKVNHYSGEAYCHKMLTFTKKKLGENYMENHRKLRTLYSREKQLHQEGKTSYIQIGAEQQLSLTLEVIQQYQDQSQSRESHIQIKNLAHQKDQSHVSTSAKRISKKDQQQAKLDEQSIASANISNVKNNIQKLQDQKHSVVVQVQSQVQQNQQEQQPLKKVKNSLTNYNLEFDKLKLQLEHSKRQDSSRAEYDNGQGEQQVAGKSIVNKDNLSSNKQSQPEVRIKRQAPQVVKNYTNNSLSTSMSSKNLKQSLLDDKYAHLMSSDNEKPQTNQSTQKINIKNLLSNMQQPLIKEEKKVNLREQAQLKIEQYKLKKNDQIEKAKTQQQSSFFVQPKNAQICQERQSFIKQRNSIQPPSQLQSSTHDTTTLSMQSSLLQSSQQSSVLKKPHVQQQRKPSNAAQSAQHHNDLFHSTQSNLTTIAAANNNQIIGQNLKNTTTCASLAQSEMIFDQANDIAFSVNGSDDDTISNNTHIRPPSSRYSLQGTASNDTISNSNNKEHPQSNQKKLLAYNSQTKTFEKGTSSNSNTLATTSSNDKNQRLKKQQWSNDTSGRTSVRNITNKTAQQEQVTNTTSQTTQGVPQKRSCDNNAVINSRSVKDEVIGRHQSPNTQMKKQQAAQQQQQQAQQQQQQQQQPQNIQQPLQQQEQQPLQVQPQLQQQVSPIIQPQQLQQPVQNQPQSQQQPQQQFQQSNPQNQQCQQLQQVSQQVITGSLFGLSVTTTTTVKIEGMMLPQGGGSANQQIPQVLIDHQPEIIIEQIDEAIRNAASQQQQLPQQQNNSINNDSNISQVQSQQSSSNSLNQIQQLLNSNNNNNNSSQQQLWQQDNNSISISNNDSNANNAQVLSQASQ